MVGVILELGVLCVSGCVVTGFLFFINNPFLNSLNIEQVRSNLYCHTFFINKKDISYSQDNETFQDDGNEK